VGASDVYKRMNNSEKKYLSSNLSVIFISVFTDRRRKVNFEIQDLLFIEKCQV